MRKAIITILVIVMVCLFGIGGSIKQQVELGQLQIFQATDVTYTQ